MRAFQLCGSRQRIEHGVEFLLTVIVEADDDLTLFSHNLDDILGFEHVGAGVVPVFVFEHGEQFLAMINLFTESGECVSDHFNPLSRSTSTCSGTARGIVYVGAFLAGLGFL